MDGTAFIRRIGGHVTLGLADHFPSGTVHNLTHFPDAKGSTCTCRLDGLSFLSSYDKKRPKALL